MTALFGSKLRFSKVGQIAAESIMIESGRAVRAWVVVQFVFVALFIILGVTLLIDEIKTGA